ncbi:uncharacterized protein LOC127008208 [Eriocheir sinensis]|uniref:uncharacterized protein LOC127008208 n=1 Tax=Eriocheir sinensis TaxID=95602 RepID=UPI0021C89433|nr:uncharacterized protein LOC127008208 [Eriocheir sinensis]
MHPHLGSLQSVTGAGQSLRDPCTSKEEGPPSPSFCFGGDRGGAEAVPTHKTRPGADLQRALCVGSWNVRSLSDDDRLPYLSNELRRLRVDIVALSETRRPGNGEISEGVFTFYWSGMSNGFHVRGIPMGISNHLPFVVEVAPVDERIMRARLKHTLGFMSLVAVYAPTEMRETEEKETFYAKLVSVLDQCPPRDTLIVLGDFSATTGIDRVRVGYELCVLRFTCTFKRETLQTAKECIGEHPRSRSGFASMETLENIEESRGARLAGNRDQYRVLSCRTSALLRRDKERYVRGLAEEVEGHLNANDHQPAYRALKKLRSKSSSQMSAIRTADGCLVLDMDGQRAHWAEYFEQLYMADPPRGQLPVTGLQVADADPPIDESPPSLGEVREAVAKLRGGKASGACNISAELLKAGGEAMIHGLHAVLTAIWQSGTIPPD